MVAHCAVRAEGFRANMADGIVLPAKPNVGQTPERRSSSWKNAYADHVWSESNLPLNLRGILQALLRLSDQNGRIWRGQPTLAQDAGCSERTLRRLLGELVTRKYLRAEKMTFKSLTAAQRALGLRLPLRADEGRAPDLLTLLAHGADASSYEYPTRQTLRASVGAQDKPARDKPHPGIARTMPPGQIVEEEPRTNACDIPPDKLADDLWGSTILTRNVEGAPEEQPRPMSVGEEDRRNVGAPNSSAGPSEAPVNLDAWRVLSAAYETHYRRVYHATPTQKRVSSTDAEAMTAHIVDLVAWLDAQLRARGVLVERLASTPLHMLANEALRTWFDSPGANGYLRRVSHPMRALVADLPFRARKAAEAVIEQYASKPEPRRVCEPVSARLRPDKHDGERNGRTRPLRWHAVAPLAAPIFLPVHTPMERPSARASPDVDISPEIEQMLTGLSRRPALREFGTDVPLAVELSAQARECGAGPAQVERVLDEVNAVIEHRGLSSVRAKKNALFAAVVEAFGEANAVLDGGKT